MPEVMRDGVKAQNNNPEVDVDVRTPNIIIEQQLLQLKIITNKLRNAYNGLDVDWIDAGKWWTKLNLAQLNSEPNLSGQVDVRQME